MSSLSVDCSINGNICIGDKDSNCGLILGGSGTSNYGSGSSLVLNCYEVYDATFIWSNNAGLTGGAHYQNGIRFTRIGNMCTITQTNTWTMYNWAFTNGVYSLFDTTTQNPPYRFNPSLSSLSLYMPITYKVTYYYTVGNNTTLYEPAYIRINTNGTMYGIYDTYMVIGNTYWFKPLKKFLLMQATIINVDIIFGTFSYNVS